MKGLGWIFQFDRDRRFPSHSLALDQMLWADCPASDCADRPLSGRDFAFPAPSSFNHSRGDLAARGVGDPVKGKQLEDEDERDCI
jgi:hypothetical protein